VGIIRVELSGDPSCVHAATLRLKFADGTEEDRDITYEPDGVMYEVFVEQVQAFRIRFVQH
jgi:hypothetical protein